MCCVSSMRCAENPFSAHVCVGARRDSRASRLGIAPATSRQRQRIREVPPLKDCHIMSVGMPLLSRSYSDYEQP